MVFIIILNIIWLHHIFSETQQITEPVRKHNTTKRNEVYKSTIWSGTKLINWDSSRKLNEFILLKWLEDTALHKHYDNQSDERL